MKSLRCDVSVQGRQVYDGPLNPSGPQIGDCRSLESEEPVLLLVCGGDLGTPAPRLFP